jgi:transposase
MRPWIGSSDRGGQLAVLPLDFRDALPEDHAAWVFLGFVDELDLAAFEAAYRADGVGRPPYPPKSILALVLYCNSKKLHSGRDIAAACHDDIGARAIMGNTYPDRTVIDRFQIVHKRALKELFPQTLRLGHAEGLVDVTVVAGDGTKVVANAALSATVDEPALHAQIADLEQQLRQAQDEWDEQVTASDGGGVPGSLFDEPVAEAHGESDGEGGEVFSQALFGGWSGDRPEGGEQVKAWRRIRVLASMLGSRQAALAYLREHPGSVLSDWQDRLTRDQVRVAACEQRLEAVRAELTAAAVRRQVILDAGGRIPGKRPVPVEDHIRVRRARKDLATAIDRAAATAKNRPTRDKVNTTDPRSRIMPGKHDGFDQRYNLQAMACRNQFILGITVHDSPNDKRAMIDLIEVTRANLDAAGITEAIWAALLDNGYASEANFTTPVPVGLLLVAVEKECRQTGRLRDGTSTAAQAWAAMADRLAEPENRDLYKRRAAIIEPLFAQLFTRFGRNFTLRGQNIDTEIFIWAITHNLLKINRARRKKT